MPRSTRWLSRALLAAAGLILALSMARPLAAQIPYAPTYVKDVVDARDGMPDTQVSAVAQTPDGFFWLGTRRGLVRYDGLSLATFTPASTPALPSIAVNALTAESNGTLWISTDKGLVVREGRTFRRIPASEIPEAVTWRVLRDRRGRVWVSGAFGIRVGDGTRFRQLPTVTTHIYSLAEDATGRIWIAGRDYFAVLDSLEAQPRVAPFSDGERFFDVVADRAGTVWTGTRHGVVQLDSRAADPFARVTRTSTASRGEWAQVWALTLDHTGGLWLGTDTRGVLRLDRGTVQPLDRETEVRPDAVWAMTTDLRGRVWAGTSGGLLRYQRSDFRTVSEGLPAKSTWSIRPDVNHTLWATTDDGQVLWLDGARWRPVFARQTNRMPGSTWPRRAGGMYVADDEGRMFVATRTGATDVSAQFGFPGDGPLGIFEDHDGAVWASTHSGLMKASGARARPIYDSVGLSVSDEPRVIMRDRRQRLLIGAPGLTIVDAAGVRRIGRREGLTDDHVLAVHEDGDRLWIGTADSGLFVMRQDRVTHVAPLHARLRRDIHGIVRDDVGALWLSSTSGLLRVSIADLEQALQSPTADVRVREFNRLDGLPSNDVNGDYQSQLFKDSTGGIWLPTAGGPVYFNPRLMAEDTVSPQIHIDEVRADGALLDPTTDLRLTARPGRVDVTFAATNALYPERVRVAYRVIGVDTAWVDLGRRRAISFGPLKGGAYRVELRVAAEDGDWNPSMASVSLAVPAAWWEQWWFVPFSVLCSALGVWLLARLRLTAAEQRERELARQVAERTADLEANRALLEVRVEERTAALARELDERTRLEQRLAAARKAESLGRLAGGVSHEINNALATVLGFAQLARGTAQGDVALQADIDEVVRAGRRAANITHQLLAFARQQHTPMRRVHVDAMVRELVRSLEQLLGDAFTLHTRIGDAIRPIQADPLQVEQLLVNLVKNARDAKPRDGTVTVIVANETLEQPRTIGDQLLPAGEYVTLAVRDTGHGISPDTMEHLFEPFFSTKDVASGTGLGLAVCQGIVARHQGAIDVESNAGNGTCFRAWFPAAPPDVDAASDERASAGGSETLLFVEDERAIRAFATRMLTGQGYRVLDAEDGAAALRVLGGDVQQVDCVVTDMMMPNMTGLELARTLRATRPDLPIVFISGFAGLDDAALREMRAMGPMIAKPFTQEELSATVRRTLDARRVPT